MTFEFKAAVRENTPIVIGIAGPSGSGKTFSGLELATGLAGKDGRIAVIDSEGRRALHYADTFAFAHGEWRPPFTPASLLEGLQAAEKSGFRVILVDSGSDEHEGEGGLLDMAAAGTSTNTAANWAKPKAEHKKIIRWLRQTRCHVVLCFRAEEKVRIEEIYNEQKQRKERVIVPLGWQPVCEKRFMYEMTASFLMTPEQPGVPQPIKLQEQHRGFFPNGKPLSRNAGKALAEWAAGAAAESAGDDLALRAQRAAEAGMDRLSAFWGGLSDDETLALKDEKVPLIRVARKADRDAAGDPLARSAGSSSATVSGDGSTSTAEPAAPSDTLPDTGDAERDPFWSQDKLFVAPVRDGSRTDWDATRDLLLHLIEGAETADELERLRAGSSDTLGRMRVGGGAPMVQAVLDAIAARLPEPGRMLPGEMGDD